MCGRGVGLNGAAKAPHMERMTALRHWSPALKVPNFVCFSERILSREGCVVQCTYVCMYVCMYMCTMCFFIFVRTVCMHVCM